ncbi:MAG: hypothetical protein IPM18_12185 [Phycisphaerales bacterium]|nr:hypothetical protein [Phycisphaerales bacterium]
MKKFKWFTLMASGAVLMQFSACATDLTFYLVQALATQVVSALLTGVAAGTGTA